MKQTYFVGFLIFTIFLLLGLVKGDPMAIAWWIVEMVVWSSLFVGYLLGGFKPW